MAKQLLVLVLLTTVTSEDPPTLSTTEDLPLNVQEGGNFSVVFALSGFSLDPSVLHQSTMVAPDGAWLWLSPNTTIWRDHKDLVLRPGVSGARPDTWRIRYEGSSLEQLGVHVEGASKYDSGNWSVLVRPTETLIVRAGFEVVVEASPTTTTSTTIEATTPMPEDVAPIFSVSATNDVPISIEEGEDFSVVFDLRGFKLNPFNNRQSSFITPDRNIFWVSPFNTTWKGVEIGSLGAQPRPTSWRVRYTGNGTQQVGLELEGATVHDSGRWNLRINIAGPYWATAEFMVAVENSTTTTNQTTATSTTTTNQTTTTSSDMTTSQTMTTSTTKASQTTTSSWDMTTTTSVATVQTVANTAMFLAIMFNSLSM